MFPGYVIACGSVRGGRPVSCDAQGRAHDVGACRVVRIGRFRGQSDAVVQEAVVTIDEVRLEVP